MPIHRKFARVRFLHGNSTVPSARVPESSSGAGQAVPTNKEKAEVPWYDTST